MKQTFRVLVVIAVTMLAAATLSAQGAYKGWQPGDDGSVRGFIGMFNPEGDSLYWNDKFDDFTGSISDFDDFSFNLDFRLPVGYSSALLFGGGWYKGSTTQAYRDWVDANGGEIRHVTTLWTFELTAAWIFELGDRDNMITPYFGVGAGYLWWELEESGDFIDFGDPGLPIVGATYRGNAGTFEYFALAGLDVRISSNVSLVAQGRWREADDELRGGLAGLGTLDLAGWEYAGGLAFHF